MILEKEITKEQARQIVSPTSDIFARYLLSSEKYKDLTKSFINAVLEDSGKQQIESLRIKSPFNLADCLTAKESVLDVEVQDKTGRMYDIEIQNASSETFFLRIAYYWAEMFRSQLNGRTQYDLLRPCIIIGLLKDRLFSEPQKPHHFSAVVDAEEPTISFFKPEDLMEYHILELGQFEINADAVYTVNKSGLQRKMTPRLFKWLRFFKDGDRENFMEKYKETDTKIAEAKNAYEEFLGDHDMIMAQVRHKIWLMDRAQEKIDARKEGLAEGRAEGHAAGLADGLKEGLKKGLKEGREKGIQEGVMETARRLKQTGIDVKIIAAATNLTEEQINEL